MSPEQLLGQIAAGDVVVADFEAGLGSLTRLKPGSVDVFLVVADPSPKALEVARRAIAMLSERGLGRAMVIANRITGAEDLEQVKAALNDASPAAVVPEEPAFRALDLAPFDGAPHAAAVLRLRELAEGLAAR
jgi:CO dehydrogenase maturation factor